MEWDPWEHLSGTDIRLLWGELPHTNGAYVADVSTVILQPNLSSASLRSALAEELAHHELGRRPVDDETEISRTELRALRWASFHLINVETLATAIVGSSSWFEVAGALDVDPDLLDVRAGAMSDEERAVVVRLAGGLELGL